MEFAATKIISTEWWMSRGKTNGNQLVNGKAKILPRLISDYKRAFLLFSRLRFQFLFRILNNNRKHMPRAHFKEARRTGKTARVDRKCK